MGGEGKSSETDREGGGEGRQTSLRLVYSQNREEPDFTSQSSIPSFVARSRSA